MQRTVLALAAVLAVVGCKRSSRHIDEVPGGIDEGPIYKPPAPPPVSPFVVAQPRVHDGGIPARFAAALPTRPEQLLDGSAFPSEAYVRARLARGDAEMEQRFRASVRAAVAAGSVSSGIALYYENVASPELCEWLRVTFPKLLVGCASARAKPPATHSDVSKEIQVASACISTGADVAPCLDTLAQLDWHRARMFAEERMSRGLDDGSLGTTLAKFDSAAARDKRLDELGFTAQHAPAEPATSVDDVLYERGHLTFFDLESDECQTRHDDLLADLAQLVAPALSDAAFEQGPKVIRGYEHGKVYELDAPDQGQWVDLDPVLGLLNAMLTADGDPQRLIALDTGDQEAVVLGGPPSGIEALAADGLIDVGSSRK